MIMMMMMMITMLMTMKQSVTLEKLDKRKGDNDYVDRAGCCTKQKTLQFSALIIKKILASLN